MIKLYGMTLLALVCASNTPVDANTVSKDTTNSTSKVDEKESGNNNTGNHDGNEINVRVVA